MSSSSTRILVLVAAAFFLIALGIVFEQLVLVPLYSTSVPSLEAAPPVPAAVLGLPRNVGASEVRGDDTPVGFVPVPPMPPEEGLLGRITDARVRGEDRDAFYLAAVANQRTESGSEPGFSRLRTTAGAQYRASFGVGQLTIRDHLHSLAQLDEAALGELGLDPMQLALMERRGDAAVHWWRVLVQGRVSPEAASALRVPEAALRAAHGHCQRGEDAALLTAISRRFADTTGMRGEAAVDLCRSRGLREAARRTAFLQAYAHEHRVAFDPANRDPSLMGRTARRLAEQDPLLMRLLNQLGGDTSAAGSLGHYLGVGDINENLFGWHARAAESVTGRAAFEALIRRADTVSSRLRELDNFEHALLVVNAVTDVRGIERARMLARIGRCFHGAPGRARRAFFFDRDGSRPRATTAAQLEALVQEYRLSRMWSDERVQAEFERVFEERRTP